MFLVPLSATELPLLKHIITPYPRGSLIQIFDSTLSIIFRFNL